MKITKKISIGLIVLVVLLAFIGVISGQILGPMLSDGAPKEATSPSFVTETTNQTVFEEGVFRDQTLGYYLQIPDGWTAGNYPGLFLSPDAQGMVGYADISGMALMIDRNTKAADVSLDAWLEQTGAQRNLKRRLGVLTTNGLPVLLYQANWDTQGKAVTAFVDAQNSVFRLSCFYPIELSEQYCQDVLVKLLPTFQLDATR